MTTVRGITAREKTLRPAAAYDVERIRADFPVLGQAVWGKPIVYLDNAATAQKPKAVIDRLTAYYTGENANIHRGVHYLSEVATAAYEEARARVQRLLHAAEPREIIFVRGTTEAINLVANSYGQVNVKEGDEIIVSVMEHHSNIVPWQILCRERGARLRVAPIADDGELILGAYEKLLGPRTKLAAITHVSNALGTINPVREIIELAHGNGVPVLLDGAQAAAHMPVDVLSLDCDFYAFSGHKLYGPTGIGVLYGKAALLEAMRPYQDGGDMIRSVTFEKTTYNDLPFKFEAGTPHIAGAIGLGAAIDYLRQIGLDRVAAYEHELLLYATERLRAVQRLRFVDTAREKAGILSFVIDGLHPHDVGTILDREGVAIRAGHHCAMPLMERLGVPATARASLARYNTREDVDALVRAIHKAITVLG